MKVCHLTCVHQRYDVRIFEKECTTLANNGFNTFLIVSDDMPDEIKNGVHIVSTGYLPRTRKDRMLKSSNMILKKALEINGDVFHLHDPELLCIVKRLKSKGKKIIFDSHEFTGEQILTKEYIPLMLRKTVSQMYKSYEKRVLNMVSGIIMPCTYNGRDYYSAVSVPKEIIGNYPSLAVLKNAVLSLNRNEKELKIGYLGGITEPRGIFQMVKAAALVGKKITLIGEISDNLMSKLNTMPEKQYVECLGKLPHDLAIKEISKCSVCLSVLQNVGQYAYLDNLPTKVYEYMFLGIPVIMSDFPFYRKVLQKYRFGIAVNPNDVNAIADAINCIFYDKKLGKRFEEEGKRAIIEDMNWERESEKLVSFYYSIIRDSI